MNFETIDWDAEARRVARAFRVEGIWWLHPDYNDVRYLRRSETGEFPELDGLILIIEFAREGRYFGLQGNGNENQVEIVIGWEGTPLTRRGASTIAASIILARGLFLLDLLTPVIESSLNIHLSAHDKLEWELERLSITK